LPKAWLESSREEAMLGVEDWAEIRRLRRAEQMSISEIARVLGISRNTVRSALARDAAPKYVRAPAASVVDAVEPPDPASRTSCPLGLPSGQCIAYADNRVFGVADGAKWRIAQRIPQQLP
jgi:transposase